jgi:hypothetical protein
MTASRAPKSAAVTNGKMEWPQTSAEDKIKLDHAVLVNAKFLATGES